MLTFHLTDDYLDKDRATLLPLRAVQVHRAGEAGPVHLDGTMTMHFVG